MLELGEKSEVEHSKLVNMLHSNKSVNAIFVGPVFQQVASKSGFRAFSDVNILFDYLTKEPVRGSTILIKGSRGIGLEKIYDIL